jgi:hypothetical protein
MGRENKELQVLWPERIKTQRAGGLPQKVQCGRGRSDVGQAEASGLLWTTCPLRTHRRIDRAMKRRFSAVLQTTGAGLFLLAKIRPL